MREIAKELDLSLRLGNLSTQSITIEPDQIPEEICHGADAAGLGKVGLGDEPDCLVDPEVGSETVRSRGRAKKCGRTANPRPLVQAVN